MSCYNYRAMPADFAEHVEERYVDLIRRYRADSTMILRWKDLCGFSRRRGRPGRAVIRRDRRGEERRFCSITEAAQSTQSGTPAKIYQAIHRGGRSCGYWWRYAEEAGR